MGQVERQLRQALTWPHVLLEHGDKSSKFTPHGDLPENTSTVQIFKSIPTKNLPVLANFYLYLSQHQLVFNVIDSWKKKKY